MLSLSLETAARFDREKWQTELSPILNLWKKLNQGTGMLQLKLQPPQGDPASPVRAFVQLESYNGVRLVQAVHRSLAALSKVIRGAALLDESVARLAAALLQQQTPPSWHRLWPGPDTPLEYIKTLVYKASECSKWVGRAEQGALLGDTLDLSDLFHPDTFLSALQQQTAREYKISMSALRLVTSWSRSGVPGAKTAIKVSRYFETKNS